MELKSITETASLEGHTRRVGSVCLAADGRLALSGSLDHTIRLWDLPSGGCRLKLEEPTDVNAVALTADARYAITASGDPVSPKSMVRMWDLTTSQPVREYLGHSGEVSTLAVDDRRGLLATGGLDTTVRLFELATGKLLHTMSGHQGWVRCVVLTSDGSTAVSGGMDGTVRTWDLASGEQRGKIDAHAGGVYGISVYPDGGRVLSCGRDNAVRAYDLATGSLVRALEGHTDAVRCVRVSRTGRLAVSGGQDKVLRVWDVESGRCLHREPATGWVLSLDLSRDGTWVAAGTYDRKVVLWKLAWS
jgi:WD40 repeat protein